MRTARARRGGRFGTVLLVVAAALLVVPVPAGAAAPDAAVSDAAVPDATVPDATAERIGDLLHRWPAPVPVSLGVPGGVSVALAVTDSGVVMGTAFVDGQQTVFRWRDGTVELLTELELSYPFAINESAQVLVQGREAGGVQRPFLWNPDGTVVDLLGPGVMGYPGHVNDQGLVTLQVTVPGGVGYAATWRDGVLRRISPPEIADSTVAPERSVNERGEVAGTVTVEGRTQAFVWRAGVFTLLTSPYGSMSIAREINGRGQVLAWVNGIGDVLWEPDGRLRRLGAGFIGQELDDHGVVVGSVPAEESTLPQPAVSGRWGLRQLRGLGGDAGALEGTNGRGVHAGWSYLPGSDRTYPAVWVLTRPAALGTEIPELGEPWGGAAYDVSSRGRAVGVLSFGTADGGVSEAVRWELVPGR